MKGKAKPRGLFAEKQHTSCSELALFGTCEYRHKLEYELGRESDNRFSVLGREGHDAIADVNRALMKNPDGIGEEDIESAKVKLARFKHYGYYTKFCQWLTEYAAKANQERNSTLAVELEIQAPLDLGMGLGVIMVRGRIDRVKRLEGGECAIEDFKLWGRIPSREELEGDFQIALYNWLLRYPPNAAVLGLDILRTWRKEWTSIFHDVTVPAKADLPDAEDAERYARDNTIRILQGGQRSKTYNNRCESCHHVKRCAEFNRGIGHLRTTAILKPTIKELVKWNERVALTGSIRDRMRDGLIGRLEKYGKPIEEDGYKAELVTNPGRHQEAYDVQPYTWARIKRVAKGARR